MFDKIKELLEVDLLERLDLLFVILPLLMSIFILEGNTDIEVFIWIAEKLNKCLFATTLIGAIIQDGG